MNSLHRMLKNRLPKITPVRAITIACLLILGSSLMADSTEFATLRDASLVQEPEPPRLADIDNSDIKRTRNYPMQPPTIPHKIDSYEVNLNANKCLACHSRNLVEESQAPMVSVTHFMDRDGNFLAEVSPRRYFCQQCHVPQADIKPLVENDFQDVGSMLNAVK